jgi:UDP:flavonoid glycosyltransferase YjiC (YdhE family)
MSRILLTWELGQNLKHLARLLPLATQLRQRGHDVLVAVREVPAAASMLGPVGIPFVQAPHLARAIPLAERVGSYADILLSQGWADPSVLWGLTQSWLNLFRMFKPDTLVVNHSPTARFSATLAQIPAVLIGNGFELPPQTNPLPAFPGFPWATDERALASERVALQSANTVAHRVKGAVLVSLSGLFENTRTLYVTFPELDHYGERKDALYVGPMLGESRTEKVEWPDGKKRIFAFLRPDTAHVHAIIKALSECRASVVCFAPGFKQSELRGLAKTNIRLVSQPVDPTKLSNADACVSNGAEETALPFLLAGVPQLVSPQHAEACMAAQRLESLGATVVLRSKATPESVVASLERTCGDAIMRRKATNFSNHHRTFTTERARVIISERVESAMA